MTSTLEPYPKMKDSGVNWLGAIPEHWDLPRLGTVLRERGTLNRDGAVQDVLSVVRHRGVIPYSEKGNVGNKKSEDTSRYKIVCPDDIVLNSMNVIIGSVGLSRYKGCLSPVYYVLVRRSDNDDVRYFSSIFQAETFYKGLIRLGNGILAHRMRIPMELLKCEPFPRPPPEEQIAIARFLDHMDRRVQKYIRAKEKLIVLLDEYKQALVHQAVTGQIDVRTGKPYVAYKPSGVEWFGEVPAHWEVFRLKSLMANVVDQTNSGALGGAFLALEHVESWTGKLNCPEHAFTPEGQFKSFQVGDVLFGKLRPYLAKVTRPDAAGCCVGEFLVLRSQRTRYDGRYAEHFLRSKLVIDTINSSTYGARMPRAEWTFIGSLGVPCPPLPEQIAIVRYLDDAITKIIRAVDRTDREIDLLREYRTRLIVDVVTGKLDVRDATTNLFDIDRIVDEDARTPFNPTDSHGLDKVTSEG